MSDSEDNASLPDELPSFDKSNETPLTRCCVRCSGAACCCILVTWAVALLFNFYAVGQNKMPTWARSWLFLSTAHQLEVYAGNQYPPPPPDFR